MINEVWYGVYVSFHGSIGYYPNQEYVYWGHYNAECLNDYVVIKNIKQALLPSIDNKIIEYNGGNNREFMGHTLGMREIELECEIIADTEEELNYKKEELIKIIYPKELHEMSISYIQNYELKIGDIYYRAKLDGASELSKIMNDNIFTLKFIAPDPVGYGESKFAYMADGNSGWGPGEEFSIGGNYPTYLHIEFSPNELNRDIEIMIDDDMGGSGAKFNMTNTDILDHVWISSEKEMVEQSSENAMNKVSIESEFFKIAPAQDNMGGMGLMVMSQNVKDLRIGYRERWL